MAALRMFVVGLNAVILAAIGVSSTPSCQECTLLSAKKDDAWAACSNFDPIVCEVSGPRILLVYPFLFSRPTCIYMYVCACARLHV